MISSTSSSDRTARPELVSAPGTAAARAVARPTDQISTENAAFLRGALVRQPAIRPEAVERARALAADPSYPPPAVIQRVAATILAAPDLSADES